MPRGNETERPLEFFGMKIDGVPDEIWCVGIQPRVTKVFAIAAGMLASGDVTGWLKKEDAESWCEYKNREYQENYGIQPFHTYRCLLCFEKV